MTGKLLVGLLVAVAVIGGGLMYWLQVYAFYYPVGAEAAEIRLTRLDGTVEPIVTEGFDGIDSESSPIRFRACFEAVNSLAMLTETYALYPDPEPLIAPGWFSCFDAAAIGADLETGAATAFLGEKNIHYGVDRVVAVGDDGQAFAWQQLNNCGETAYDGSPVGEACPERAGDGN